MTLKRLLPYILIFSAVFVTSCKHDPITSDIDWELYEMAQITNGYTWYKFSNSGLPKSAGTGHNNPKLRTRYNSIASRHLDSNGMVIVGTQFAEGSVIVKELMSNNEELERYAILFKDSDNEAADSKGWVWGYMDADGKVAAPANDKGKACLNCHSQSGSIDYGLMNKAFPL